jgi:hypothetical protein
MIGVARDRDCPSGLVDGGEHRARVGAIVWARAAHDPRSAVHPDCHEPIIPLAPLFCKPSGS